MINEVLAIEEILNGENVNEKCLYGTCFLIAKYFKEKGCSYVEIRDKIFEWGKEYHYFLDFNLSAVIHRALDDYVPLRDDKTVIYINDDDISEIKRRFDSEPCRKTALGMLCYAKAVNDEYDEFYISLSAFSFWLNYKTSNMSGKYLKELVMTDYIERLENKKTYAWDKKVVPAKSKSLHLKILVPTENNGDYMLVENDIDRLYSDIFEKQNLY